MIQNFLRSTLFIAFIMLSTSIAEAQYQSVPNHTTGGEVPPTIYINPDAALQAKCTSCSFTAYRLVRQLNCGATQAIEDILHEQPSCKMIPRVTHSGAIMLEWDTTLSDVAFIDLGVGHVAPEGGARIVTPKADTTYNMTVVSPDGLVGVCSAIVNVSGAKAEVQELLVLGQSPQSGVMLSDSTDSTQIEGPGRDTSMDEFGSNEPWYKSIAFKTFALIIFLIGFFIFFIRFILSHLKNE